MTWQVMAARKGLRSQFKAFLGIRKASGVVASPDPSARSSSAIGQYDAASSQLQMRALADSAFMLQVSPWSPSCPGVMHALEYRTSASHDSQFDCWA